LDTTRGLQLYCTIGFLRPSQPTFRTNNNGESIKARFTYKMASKQSQDSEEDFAETVKEFASLNIFATDFGARAAKSRQTLTEEEVNAREEWNTARSDFISRYLGANPSPSLIKTVSELLDSTILPPALAQSSPSARSHYQECRNSRYYPPTLDEWTSFTDIVSSFVPPNAGDPLEGVLDVLYSCALSMFRQQCRNEAEEQSFLHHVLWSNLASAKFMLEREQIKKTLVIGLPDNVSFVAVESDDEDSGRPAAVVEMKSSHNLLVPLKFTDIKQRYEKGWQDQNSTQSSSRNSSWCHIGHPLAQTLAYMVDNNCRYGALCSASKTYFLFIDPNGMCKVTRAWVTCEKIFFRAWAAFLHHAKENYVAGEVAMPSSWLQMTPIQEKAKKETPAEGGDSDPGDGPHGEDGSGPDRGGDEDGETDGGKQSGSKRKNRLGLPRIFSQGRGSKKTGNSRGRKATNKGPVPDVAIEKVEKRPESEDVSSVLPTALYRYSTPPSIQTPAPVPFDFEADFVPFTPLSNLRFGKTLGSGSNGDVFEASFEGVGVAVKQFDLSKRFDSYMNEVLAYKFLRDAWDKHVPMPIFVSASKSGNVRLLGMTKGRTPTEHDNDENDSLSGAYLKQVEILEEEFRFRHMDVWNNGGNFVLDEKGNVLVIDVEHWEEVV